MSAVPSVFSIQNRPLADSIKQQLSLMTEDLLTSLPRVEQLSPDERRGIIARYSSVLEANFIYWMTGAHLAAQSEEAREIIRENLLTEVRDCHPGMIRRFAIAASAVPSDSDALAVYPQLTQVRLFIGRLSGAPLIAMMAFFENFIQGFMAYLAELAERQGSEEQEYTDVHGICDIAHSQELFQALEAEMAVSSDTRKTANELFEGVYLLRTLIQAVIANPALSAPSRHESVSKNVH